MLTKDKINHYGLGSIIAAMSCGFLHNMVDSSLFSSVMFGSCNASIFGQIKDHLYFRLMRREPEDYKYWCTVTGGTIGATISTFILKGVL